MQQFIHYSHIVCFLLASLLRRLQPKIFLCVLIGSWFAIVICHNISNNYLSSYYDMAHKLLSSLFHFSVSHKNISFA